MRVAINGAGQIGRNVIRAAMNKHLDPMRFDGEAVDPNGDHMGYADEVERMNVDIVAINDLCGAEQLAPLLRHSTNLGHAPYQVQAVDDGLRIGHQQVTLTSERDARQLPWGDLGIDVVVEATGAFKTSDTLSAHLDAGAKYMLLTRPHGDADDSKIYTAVLGVNAFNVPAAGFSLYSNASCTTNCSAPLIKILNDAYGVSGGILRTVHAYTNDQKLVDSVHDDARRGYAAGENIVPTTTGARKAIGQVLPDLDADITGMAWRVPVATGSAVDMVLTLKDDPSTDELRETLRAGMKGLDGIVQYTAEPVVSSWIVGNPASSVVDEGYTQRLGKNQVQVVAWYDNEWGYANRVVDIIATQLSGVGIEPLLRQEMSRYPAGSRPYLGVAGVSAGSGAGDRRGA